MVEWRRRSRPAHQEVCSSGRRNVRVGAGVWVGWSAALAAVVVLACSEQEGPTATSGEPELAGPAVQCNAANIPGTVNDFVPAAITAQFTGGNRTAVRAQCTNILKKVQQGDLTTALGMVVNLADYIQEHSSGDQDAQITLINGFLAIVGGDPIPDVGEDGFLGVIPPEGTNGPVYSGDGKSGFQLPPGWSNVPRIVFSEPLPNTFLLDVESLEQFPTYRRHGTIPDEPFLIPGFLAHCAEAPSFDNAFLRLAKNQDEFDDPNGVEFEGIEIFPADALPPGFALPDCPVPEEDEPPVLDALVLGGAQGGTAARGGKRGGSGLELAGRLGTGSQVSAFSEWGIVSVEETEPEEATISGTTFRTVDTKGGPFEASEPNVPVDLFCNEDSEPRATTESNSDGHYSFDSAEDGFEVGDECHLEAAKEIDGGTLEGRNPETESFTVEEGENDRDIELHPVDAATITGTVTYFDFGTEGQQPFPDALVTLNCFETSEDDFVPQSSTTTDEGGAYEFGSVLDSFEVGDSCFVEAEGVPPDSSDTYDGQSETVDVQEGENVIDNIETFPPDA